MDEQKFKKINIRELLRYSKNKQVRPLHIILANRAMQKLGEIDNIFDITYHPQLAASDELSFTVYKEAGGRQCRLWNDIIQFRLIWVKEYKEWFQITFEIDDSEKIPKKVISAVPLCEAELSQINMDEMGINTEADIARKDYENPTVFYNPDAVNCSLLHRVLKKIPNYSIKHVDDTLCNLQRSFSVDGSTNIYDWLTGTLAKEIGCLFLFDSNERGIYVYDIETMCMGTVEKEVFDENGNKLGTANEPCNYRSINEFDVCPKCGCTTVSKPYGFDTTIFVDKNNLGNDIKLQIDTDQIKNCFEIKGGDDLITNTVRNISPNGSNKIWHFNEDMLLDMPDELKSALEKYETDIKRVKESVVFNVPPSCIGCNSVIDKVANAYKSMGTDMQKDFPYTPIKSSYKGFSSVIEKLYELQDFHTCVETTMMPAALIAETTAQEQMNLLLSNISPISVSDVSILTTDENGKCSTVDNAITLVARSIIDTSKYKFEITKSYYGSGQIWKGRFKITSYTDDNDSCETDKDDVVTIQINDDRKNFITQKINKVVAKIEANGIKNINDIDISTDEGKTDFQTELQKYCLDSLNSFEFGYESVLDVLMQYGASSESKFAEDNDIYEDLYSKYKDKRDYIIKEIEVRENDLDAVKIAKEAFQDWIKAVQQDLNLKNFLGDLYNTFISYCREDIYSNENYVSDGLGNAELIKKSQELTETAEQELMTSCEKQYSITATLNNLLLIKDENGDCVFEPLLDDFTLGNFIRCKIDGKIYKMRISDITIDYNDLSKLSITFYDVVSANSMMSKPKNLLDTIQSIGSSYSYTAKQAKQGEQANLTFNELQQNGLNSAQYNIFNTNSTVVFDEHGLLARNYDDVTDDYSDEQLRINGCNLLMTDNNWKSARLAIGKQKYELNGVVHEEWGLNADFCIASTIIGGDIYSANYKTDENGDITNGTHFNLISGDFELADGRIIYESEHESKPSKMTLKDVTIQWNNVNAPEINDINGLSDLKNGLDNLEKTLGYNGTTIAGTHIYSPTISGGSITGGSILIGDYPSGTYAEIDKNGNFSANSGFIGGLNISNDGVYFEDQVILSDNSTIDPIKSRGCGMQKYTLYDQKKKIYYPAFWAGGHGIGNGGTDSRTEFKILHDGTGSIAGFDFDAYGLSTTRSVPDENGNFAYAKDNEELSKSCCGMQGYGFKYGDWLPAFWAGDNGYGHGGTGAIFRVSHHGDLWIGSNESEKDILDTDKDAAGKVPFRVTRDGNCYLGSGQITSSDKNYKNSITSLDSQKSSDFIYNLNPVSFKYNNNTSDRLHHGLVAQEVKTAMGDNDWGVYIQEDNGHCGLRYEELIADLIATVQSQNKRIQDLENIIFNK